MRQVFKILSGFGANGSTMGRVTGILGLSIVQLWPCFADEQKPRAASPKQLMVVMDDDTVSVELLNAVVGYVRKNSGANAVGVRRSLPVASVSNFTPIANGFLASNATECVVMGGRVSGEFRKNPIFLLTSRTGLINLDALLPPESDMLKADLVKPLTRAAMRLVGLMADGKLCPNPHCALFDENMGRAPKVRGRNYCPPCAERVGEALEKKHVLTLPDPEMMRGRKGVPPENDASDSK